MTSEEYSLEVAKAYASAAGKESVAKIANAVQKIFPFWGIKKEALDAAIEGIKNSSSSPEEQMFRILDLKEKHRMWKNQSSILDVAFSVLDSSPELPPSSEPELDEEFLSRLLDASKHVSDEDAQIMWGNILAGELENPGKTPRSVIRVLSEMSKVQAEAFSILCSMYVYFVSADENGTPSSIEEALVVPNLNYLSKSLFPYDCFSMLTGLESLGLIQTHAPTGLTFKFDSEPPQLYAVYHDTTLHFKSWSTPEVPCGFVNFTPAGKHIARFVERQNLDGYASALKEYLCSNSVFRLNNESNCSLKITKDKSSYSIKLTK